MKIPRLQITPNLKLAALGLLLAAASPSVFAAAQTWDDNGPSNIWSTSAPNWDGGVAWIDGNNSIFGATTGETVEIDGTVVAAGLAGTGAFPAIRLSTGYSLVDSNSNGVLELRGTGGSASTSKPIITSTGTNSISVNILLSGSTNSNNRTISPGTSLTISGNISEADGSKGLTISGGGTLMLSGDNTFSGTVAFSNSGTRLNIGSATALGTGALTNNQNLGSIDNTSGASLTLTNNNALNLGNAAGNGITFVGTDDLNFGTGAVTLSGNATQAINITAGTLTLGGAIGETGGSRGISKGGAGTLVLGGANTYTGNTTVSTGTLLLETASESRFLIQDENLSNRFLGSGMVTFDGLFRLDISGLTDSVGTWNLVNVDTLNGTFGASFGLMFLDDTAFANNFDGTYSSGGWTFDTSTGNLTAVPEPSTIGIAFFGFLSVIVVHHRRKRRDARSARI